jgi:hypothetical protein
MFVNLDCYFYLPLAIHMGIEATLSTSHYVCRPELLPLNGELHSIAAPYRYSIMHSGYYHDSRLTISPKIEPIAS